MKKTTVYLLDELADDIKSAARRTGRSEAEVIRSGVRREVAEAIGPIPTLPLFASGDPTMADRTEELLAGFGQE